MDYQKYFFRFLFVVISTLASLLIVEILLWFFTNVGVMPSYKVQDAGSFYDKELGYRIPPRGLPEIDENGFRNPSVPEDVDVVSIGDSMTYGYNALSSDSWVYQLGRKINKSVYNISIGGGDPPQYLVLLDEALELDPKTIVVGLYLGNDIAGSCFSFWNLDFWKNYAREKKIDITECLNPNSDFWGLSETKSSDKKIGILKPIKNSYLFSFVKNIYPLKKLVWAKRAKELVKKSDDFYLFENQGLNLLFDLTRSRLVDRTNPTVKNGYDVTKILFSEMKNKVGERGLIVVFIPTKENVFYDFLAEKNYDVSSEFKTFVQNQRSLVSDLTKYFNGLGIVSIDARPFFEKRISSKNPMLYLEYNRDDHPTKVGYEAIAEAVDVFLSK